MKPLHFCLLGGDTRQHYLAIHLRQDGHRVTTFALGSESTSKDPSVLSEGDCVLFPMPISRTPTTLHAPFSDTPTDIASLLPHLSARQFLCGGGVPIWLQNLARERGLEIHDYLAREELAIANAVPTAEGAIQLAMEHLPITIHKCRVLIIGFGRVGQCTAQRFASLGAQVTVAARRPAQLALADAMNLSPLPLSQLMTTTPRWDLIVNTVPAPILTGQFLLQLGKTPILELASPPGGVDPEAANGLSISILSAPGLPGKVAPATAARAIQDTVYRMLEEAGY